MHTHKYAHPPTHTLIHTHTHTPTFGKLKLVDSRIHMYGYCDTRAPPVNMRV